MSKSPYRQRAKDIVPEAAQMELPYIAVDPFDDQFIGIDEPMAQITTCRTYESGEISAVVWA